MNEQQPETKLFLMTMKIKTGKSGATFYTGKLGSLDVIGFLKKDQSGDITMWVKQAPMRDFQPKPAGQSYAPQQQQHAQSRPKPKIVPRPQVQNHAPQSGPPENFWDGPDPEMEF